MKKIVFLLICLLQVQVFSETIYEIPIYDQAREPLVIIKDGVYSGIIIDALVMILERAQVKFKFTPLPNERRRQGFIDEKFVIECCSNEHWRTKPEEVKIQIFSDDFFEFNDVFIFSDKKSKNTKDLEKLIFGLVKGYDYGGFENQIKKKYHLQTETTLLDFLGKSRAEVAIIDESIFDFYSNLYPNLIKGKIFKNSKLKIRVNKKEIGLYNLVNKAIKELKSEDAFSKIKLKYKVKEH